LTNSLINYNEQTRLTKHCMKIIHLSDFHLEKEEPSKRKKSIITSLITDLKSRISNDSIIAFTGDLIDKGGKQFKDKETSFLFFEDTFIKPLLNGLNLSEKHFFMVPGNHDIIRNEDDMFSEIGLQTKLTTRESIEEFIVKNKQRQTSSLNKIALYKDFEKSFYGKLESKKITIFDSSFIIDLCQQKIGVACLNSSWRCYDDTDKGKLIIGENQVLSALEYIQNCDIKIALIHHNFDWLIEVDSKTIKPIIEREFDIILSGHVHSADGYLENGFWGKIFNSISASTIADYPNDREYVNGYSIIEFEKNDHINVEYRKFDEKNQKFILDTEKGNNEGFLKLNFPTEKEISSKEKQSAAIDKIIQVNIPQLDEHLITYGTDTKCSLKEVFVEPRISNVPNSRISDKKILYYTINEIIQNDSNFLIYGSKESGKTILIDKFLIEIVHNYKELNQIPILIDFNDVGNKDFDTIISRFLNLGINDVKEFLVEERVVLLIDNLSFDQRHHFKLNRLNAFVRIYPKVKVIATSLQILESSIPNNYLEFNSELNFQLGFIQNLQSKEIKALIQNWYRGENIDFKENIQLLINSFDKLSLPRTPLSVTLFLWIIERQEKKPINNSTLVEIFVENLLEKANFEQIFSQTFDYRNKERLLSHIAKFMLEFGNGDENYKTNRSDLELYIRDYLDKRIEVSTKDILCDFVKRGILVEVDDYFIRFKASFMFHYFLAKYMGINSDFKSYVLESSNYLEFMQEIEYYTGLKRDDKEILEFTQFKLVEAYTDINEQLVNKNIDAFFETKDKASAQISLEKVKHKPSEQDLEEMFDEQLSEIPVNTAIPKKKTTVDTIAGATKVPIDKVLKLAALVLKNSEEIDDIKLREAAYKNVLKCSIAYLVAYKASFLMYYDKNKKTPEHFPENIDIKLFLRFLPLMHQILLFDWLGSFKMTGIVRAKIREDKSNQNISELEKFLSVFIYADVKGSDYIEEIKKYLKFVKGNYLKDASFIKLITYYFMRSKSKETDNLYLELMSDVSGKQRRSKDEFKVKLSREKRLNKFKGSDEE